MTAMSLPHVPSHPSCPPNPAPLPQAKPCSTSSPLGLRVPIPTEDPGSPVHGVTHAPALQIARLLHQAPERFHGSPDLSPAELGGQVPGSTCRQHAPPLHQALRLHDCIFPFQPVLGLCPFGDEMSFPSTAAMPQLCPPPKTRKRGPSVPFNKLLRTLGWGEKTPQHSHLHPPRLAPESQGKLCNPPSSPTQSTSGACPIHTGDLLLVQSGSGCAQEPDSGGAEPQPCREPPGPAAPSASTGGRSRATRASLATDLCRLQRGSPSPRVYLSA